MPRYAKLSEINLKIAQTLLETYQAHIGEKKKHIKNIITELESKGFEYRFIRGLSTLLDRKSTFKCDSKINPMELRRKIFQATQTFGLATTTENRKRVLDSVASEMGLSLQEVEEAFYSDLDGELILREVASLSPADLLMEYNLSLTQTLLFSCTELSFNASGNWQQTFFVLKQLGLIYDITRDNGFTVVINGPASLFKLTRRYGVAIAKLLPIIVANQEWQIDAKIFWKYSNEICNFKLENKKHSSLFKKHDFSIIKYDSDVEEKFASQFRALNSGWDVKREPEPVAAGKQVIIPDFSLEKKGTRIYVEIMGFWTETYLMRKIEKLQQINVKMLLLVNEALACEKLSKIAAEKALMIKLIFYTNKIPWAQILGYLNSAFEETKKKEMEFLKHLPIKFTEEVLTFEDFSIQTGVSLEAIKAVFGSKAPDEYVVLSNSLIKKGKLAEIKKVIEDRLIASKKISLLEATQLIESVGVMDTTDVLTKLNYKIIWHGISAQQAEISRADN